MLRSYGEAVRSPSPSPRGATGSALALARKGLFTRAGRSGNQALAKHLDKDVGLPQPSRCA